MLVVMTHPSFRPPLLEECIVLAVNTLLARKNLSMPTTSCAPPMMTAPSHPESLLKCAVRCLLEHLQRQLKDKEVMKKEGEEEEGNKEGEGLSRVLVWWMVVREQLPLEVSLSEEERRAIACFTMSQLQVCVGWQQGKRRKPCLLEVQSALDCCSVVSVYLPSSRVPLPSLSPTSQLLHSSDLVAMVTDQWVDVVTWCVVQLTQQGAYMFVVCEETALSCLSVCLSVCLFVPTEYDVEFEADEGGTWIKLMSPSPPPPPPPPPLLSTFTFSCS